MVTGMISLHKSSGFIIDKGLHIGVLTGSDPTIGDGNKKKLLVIDGNRNVVTQL